MLRRQTRNSGSLPTSGGNDDISGFGAGYGGGGDGSSSYGGYSGGYGGSGVAYGGGMMGSSTTTPPYTSSSDYGGYSVSSSSINNSGSYKEKTSSRRIPYGTSPVMQLLSKLKEPWIWPIFTTIIFAYMTISYRSKYISMLSIMDVKNGGVKEAQSAWDNVIRTRDTRQRQITTLQEQQKKNIQKQNECEQDRKKIMKERDELRVKFEVQSRKHEEERNSTREKAWREQVHLLQAATQRESRRSASERFGLGPHYVQFTVDLVHLPEKDAMKTFVIEMAPLSLMPHAVHLFLEQVDHKLWDNAWFYINGPHVLQGGPQADEDEVMRAEIAAGKDGEVDERDVALRPFRLKNLESLAFPEYSDKYPHIPWTVGFTGRPGGPDFYINKMDNSESHGPGGQILHDLVEFADACFARVYSGFETIEAMIAAPTNKDDPVYKYFFDEPIHILRAQILESPPVQSQRDIEMLKHADATTNSRGNSSTQKQQLPLQANPLLQVEEVVKLDTREHKKPKRPFKKPDIDGLVEP